MRGRSVPRERAAELGVQDRVDEEDLGGDGEGRDLTFGLLDELVDEKLALYEVLGPRESPVGEK